MNIIREENCLRRADRSMERRHSRIMEMKRSSLRRRVKTRKQSLLILDLNQSFSKLLL